MHGIPFKQYKGRDVRWLRVEIFELYESKSIKIDVSSTYPEENAFYYTVTVDQAAYLQIQKEQSVKVCHNDFAKRIASLFDFCLL